MAGAVDVMFALRVAHRLGLPGGGRGAIDRAQAVLAQAQRERRSVLEQALVLACSPLSAREFGQAVEALQQQAANQLAPFDERFACLLDEVSWPDGHATAERPARRLASPWLAHGLMMAMATGCAGAGAQPPIADAATEPGPIILLDAPVPTPRDTQPVEARLPQEACAADGGQSESLDGGCDVNRLEDAVSRVAGWSCEANGLPTGLAYAVEIDCDGRVVDLLYPFDRTPVLSGDARQAWLDSLANDRWVCFAGQSVQFTCMICLFPP